MTHQASAPIGNDLDSREPGVALRPRPLWVHAAFAFTILFLALHVYWAVGGTWGLPPAAVNKQAAVQAANWVVSAIMAIGAVYILALNHPISRRIPWWLLLPPIWAGAVVCLSHAVFGFVTKALYLAGRQEAVNFPDLPWLSAAEAAESNRLAAWHDLLIFEPCFLLQGALLALAAWQFIRTPAGRRNWSRSIIIGTVVIDVLGLGLTLVGTRISIG